MDTTNQGKKMNTITKTGFTPAYGRQDAFTLMDLAVVIATLGILTVLVLPALAVTKNDSQSFQCENNLKQLAAAWLMYSDAANDLMANLSTYQTSRGLGSKVVAHAPDGLPWRTDIMDLTYSLPAGMAPNSAAAQKYLTELGFKQPTPTTTGPLYPFVPFADIVHCPADFRINLSASKYGTYGGPYSFDSYDGCAYLHGEQGGYTKRSQVLHPSGRFIWTEAAAMRGENLGSWEMSNYGRLTDSGGPFHTAQFSDSPAAFHGGSAMFNFCDGHVELHKWQAQATIAFANDTTAGKDDFGGSPAAVAAERPGNVDAIWVASRYAGPQNP